MEIKYNSINLSDITNAITFDVENQKQEVGQIQMRLNGYEANKITVDNRIDKTEKLLEEIQKRLNNTISYVHQCACCGAHLEIPENRPVFHCRYCNATYLIGTLQLNSNY